MYSIRYILFALLPVLFACKTNYRYVNQQYAPLKLGNYELRMELAKGEYYEFEPVLAKFTLINHDTLPLILTNHFLPESYANNSLVYLDNDDTNDSAKYYHYIRSKHRSLISHGSDNIDTIIILPKDTFFTAVPLNNWSFNDIKDRNKKMLFRNFADFREGLYIFYYCYTTKIFKRQYTHLLESNQQFLNIEKNTNENQNLLDKLRENRVKYPDLITEFPNSIFREHLIKEILMGERYNINNTSLIAEYERFISEFPESYSLLDDKFIKYYIYLLVADCSNANEAYVFLRQKLTNPLLLKYISNLKRIENILANKPY